jgi:hypothetical protein
MDNVKTDSETSIIDACIEHGRETLATQLALVKGKGYDFAPQFNEMTIQLYLFGAIWRFVEDLDSTKNARDEALSAIRIMLISDGKKPKQAQQRIEFLKKMSKLEDGGNALPVAIGYQSEPDDNSLAEVFDHYVDDVQVSGAFGRLYEQIRKTMLYGGLFVAFIVIWVVTLYFPENSALAVFAAGAIAAAIFVIPVFIVGLLIYWFKIKRVKDTS